jgi:anti-sigma factor RsiW
MADQPFRLRTCRSVREQLSAFLDDEVSDADAVDIARHVSRCEACAAELEGIRLARDAVRSLPSLKPPARLFGSPQQSPRHRRPLILLGIVGGVALAGTIFAVGGETGQVVPPVDDLVVDHVTNTGGDLLLTPVRVEK